MFGAFSDVFKSLAKPSIKKVFFPSLAVNRKLLLWYAGRVVSADSLLETAEKLKEIDDLRKQGKSLTFICNHLTYADSHIIETLLKRNGFGALADHLIHVA